MGKKFTEWLKRRDKDLVEAIANEGFGDWFRRHPGISKGLQTATLGAALGHGVEATPGLHGAHHEPAGQHGPVHGGHDDHGPKTPAAPKPFGNPGEEHERHRQHAQDELLFHYAGENYRKRLMQIALKFKRNPNDPKFKTWLLNMFKKVAGIASVEQLARLPGKVYQMVIAAAERTMEQAQHMFSELPEGEPDPDIEDAMKEMDPTRSRGEVTPMGGPGNYSGPMDRGQYRHRKQHRGGY